MASLLPRARLLDVVTGRAPLVGARCRDDLPRGWISPVEARVHLGIAYGDLREDEARYLADHGVRGDAAVVARALLTRLLALPDGASREPRPWIVSARVDDLTIEQALDAVLARPRGPGARRIFFVHPHALNLAAFDAAFAARIGRADVVLPDGIGIRVAASIVGAAPRANINGTDLLPLLCREAAGRGLPLALVGGAPGVADECATRLRAATPGLAIPLVQHGFLDDAASREVAARVRSLGRCVVLVGMGSPRQEAWVERFLADAGEATALTVGGLFDFYSGRVVRAPLAWRELGLEWAWRLRQEPRRLAKRYLLGNPLFVTLAVRQRVTARR